MVTGFDIDELASIKNRFHGNSFQWVKTKDKNKLGKVVTVVDVEFGKRINTPTGVKQKYVATLSDGSNIDTELLNSDLMMILSDQSPMTLAEVLSINEEPLINFEEVKAALPSDLKELSTLQNIQPRPPFQEKENPQKIIPSNSTSAVQPTNLFGMFTLEEVALSLVVSVKLPTKSLLKMMYSNSQNKEDFIDKLSEYINNSIDRETIKKSVKRFIGQNKQEDEL